jgi:fructose-bisphosphate aldolase class 1
MKGSITTVKVDNGLYESFKIQNIKSKFHLQDLVNRAMYLYLNDKEFKDKLYNLIIPVLSEEAQITKLNITGSKN